MQIEIVVNHFFGTGSIIITIIYEIADVAGRLNRRHQKTKCHEISFPRTRRYYELLLTGPITHNAIRTRT